MADLRGLPLRATSDLHFSARTAAYGFAALRELYADTLQTKGTTVLVGDIFDQAVSVHMPTWNRLRAMLQGWPGKIYVIAGNHDQYDGWRNCLEGLAGGACSVISEPRWTPLGRMIPYTKPDLFRAALDGVPGAPPLGEPMLDFLWTHHGFRGAYRNAMSRDTDGVSLDDVPPRTLVITGHYHMPQNLGRIIYCGSPYETSFAEEGQQKGWLRWADPFANPVPVRVRYEDVGAPRHFTVHWDPADGPPVVPSEVQPRDRVRVVTQATRSVAKSAVAQLVQAGLEGAAIMARPDAGSQRGVLTPGMSTEEAVGRYVVANADKWDPAEMQEYAQEAGLWDATR